MISGASQADIGVLVSFYLPFLLLMCGYWNDKFEFKFVQGTCILETETLSALLYLFSHRLFLLEKENLKLAMREVDRPVNMSSLQKHWVSLSCLLLSIKWMIQL